MVCLFCPCLELNNSLVSHSDGCTQRKFTHGSTGAECHQKYLWSLCFLPVVLRRNAFNFIPINSYEHSILSQSQQNTSLSLSEMIDLMFVSTASCVARLVGHTSSVISPSPHPLSKIGKIDIGPQTVGSHSSQCSFMEVLWETRQKNVYGKCPCNKLLPALEQIYTEIFLLHLTVLSFEVLKFTLDLTLLL